MLERTAVSEQAVIQRPMELREGLTIYTRWGNTVALVLSFALIAAGWAFQLRGRPSS